MQLAEVNASLTEQVTTLTEQVAELKAASTSK